MRDPKRIGPVLALIRHLWEANPDLRLGQLIDNARVASGSHGDLFYLEDVDLQIGLAELITRSSKS